MNKKPQWAQKLYWCYEIFDTFIKCEPNIYQVINVNSNNVNIKS